MGFAPLRPDPPLQVSIMEEAGRKLKRARERLKLRFRDVEEASAQIAARRGNDEFIVALSRLADFENKGTMPSIYRLYSLCAIYRLELADVLSWYGIALSALPADAAVIELEHTSLVGFRPEEGDAQVPIALDPGLDLSRTVFLSRLIQRWGTVPLMLLNNIDLRSYRYGLIGTEDWSMFPIIPPGSLVVIDDYQTARRHQWMDQRVRSPHLFPGAPGRLRVWLVLSQGRTARCPAASGFQL